jgi:hypothetical protein
MRKDFSELWDDYERSIRLINKYINENNVYVVPKRHNQPKVKKDPKLNLPFDDQPSRILTKTDKPIIKTKPINNLF